MYKRQLQKLVQLLVRNRIWDVDILITHYFAELRPVSAGPMSCWRDVFEAKLEHKTYGVVVSRIVGGVHLPVRDPPPEAPRDGDVNARLPLRCLEGWGSANVFEVQIMSEEEITF